MRLNDLSPAKGSRKAAKRVGRGASAGQGQTAGRGVKGQKSRSGGFHKVGFEGGQMPLQRRLPKVGFRSQMAGSTAEVRLHELKRFAGQTVDLEALKAAHIVPKQAVAAKVIASGSIDVEVKLDGIKVTPGAKKAIEAAGGSAG
ncbi:MAG: 50S ribosomal protein L15 [Gammaproteobacteria bacterium]|nr:50S ribosomal protein L15 [Gammaproteobacteria bacterium]